MMGKNGVRLVEYNKFEIHRKMKKGGLKVSEAGIILLYIGGVKDEKTRWGIIDGGRGN